MGFIIGFTFGIVTHFRTRKQNGAINKLTIRRIGEHNFKYGILL